MKLLRKIKVWWEKEKAKQAERDKIEIALWEKAIAQLEKERKEREKRTIYIKIKEDEPESIFGNWGSLL